MVGLLLVLFFSFKTPVFFTADNFNNVIVQMAGTCMLAYGVVFVLLLGEIDLSIGYLSGLAAVFVAELQLPGTDHDFPFGYIAPVPGLLAIAITVAAVGVIGAGQGIIVAKVGVPSFVVTLAGLLIFQGLILQILESGERIIEDNWINDMAYYYFSEAQAGSWRRSSPGFYSAVVLFHVVGHRRAGLAIRQPWIILAKVVGVAVACFGTVAISSHADVPKGLPLAGVLVVVFLVLLTYLAKRTAFGRHVYAVGGNAGRPAERVSAWRGFGSSCS